MVEETNNAEHHIDEALPEFVTRQELLRHIKEKLGVPVTDGTMAQMCMPSRNQGPPVAAYWGRRPIYNLEEGLAWARERLQPAPHRLHPHYGRKQTGPPDS